MLSIYIKIFVLLLLSSLKGSAAEYLTALPTETKQLFFEHPNDVAENLVSMTAAEKAQFFIAAVVGLRVKKSNRVYKSIHDETVFHQAIDYLALLEEAILFLDKSDPDDDHNVLFLATTIKMAPFIFALKRPSQDKENKTIAVLQSINKQWFKAKNSLASCFIHDLHFRVGHKIEKLNDLAILFLGEAIHDTNLRPKALSLLYNETSNNTAKNSLLRQLYDIADTILPRECRFFYYDKLSKQEKKEQLKEDDSKPLCSCILSNNDGLRVPAYSGEIPFIKGKAIQYEGSSLGYNIHFPLEINEKTAVIIEVYGGYDTIFPPGGLAAFEKALLVKNTIIVSLNLADVEPSIKGGVQNEMSEPLYTKNLEMINHFLKALSSRNSFLDADQVQDLSSLASAKKYLYGGSFGGGVVARYAAKYHDVEGIICHDAAFDSRSLFKNVFSVIGDLPVPILILHNAEDARVCPTTSLQLYQKAVEQGKAAFLHLTPKANIARIGLLEESETSFSDQISLRGHLEPVVPRYFEAYIKTIYDFVTGNPQTKTSRQHYKFFSRFFLTSDEMQRFYIACVNYLIDQSFSTDEERKKASFIQYKIARFQERSESLDTLDLISFIKEHVADQESLALLLSPNDKLSWKIIEELFFLDSDPENKAAVKKIFLDWKIEDKKIKLLLKNILFDQKKLFRLARALSFKVKKSFLNYSDEEEAKLWNQFELIYDQFQKEWKKAMVPFSNHHRDGQ